MRLAELGFNDGPVRAAFERAEPVIEEFEQTADVTLLTYSIPLLVRRQVTGGVLLLRDVSELRRRDRLLLSKDATIREIHHRVKNNLQTISSLLRLQARRLTSPEAKAAVNESVRRIRTIALVHETLSREAGDDVAFIEIVRPLLRLAEESLQSPDRPVRFRVSGDGGKLPAIVATPLSVVLTELLQNAVDHGFPEGSGGGNVVVDAGQRRHTNSRSRSSTTAWACRPGFTLDAATGLGLSSCAPWSPPSWPARSRWSRPTADDLDAAGLDAARGGTGTVVRLRVPVDLEAADARTRSPRTTTPPGEPAASSDRVARVRPRRPPRPSAGDELTADLAPLLLAGATPDARVLVGLEGELEAVGAAPGTGRTPRLARSICTSAWPVVPTGKNRSGSVSRQMASRASRTPRWRARGWKQGWSRSLLVCDGVHELRSSGTRRWGSAGTGER